MTDELKELGESIKLKFSHIVTTGRDYDWDDYNSIKSVFQKALTLAKNQYFASTLTGARHIWNYIKTISGGCLLYTSPSPRDMRRSRMPSSA